MEFWPTVAIALISSTAGGLFAHLLSLQRDTKNARRTQRIDYRVQAYRDFAHSLGRDPQTDSHEEAIENAYDDILLFGTQKEVTIAQDLMAKRARTGDVDLRPLLSALRENLRKELRESRAEVDPERLQIRFVREVKPPTPPFVTVRGTTTDQLDATHIDASHEEDPERHLPPS